MYALDVSVNNNLVHNCLNDRHDLAYWYILCILLYIYVL